MNFPKIFQPDYDCITTVGLEIRYTNTSFKQFLIKDPFNKLSLILISVNIVIQLFIFKYYYPNIGFINGDSYAYITSAFYNLRADIYPIGYPKFLRLVSVVSYYDGFLFAVQYLLIHASLLGLIYSVFFFYDHNKKIKIIIILITSANPIYLFLANYVGNDALFFALSAYWFTILVWLLNRPNMHLIIQHGIIIAILFSIRYNALFYPIISGVAFLLIKKSWQFKVLGSTIPLILICSYVLFTQNQFERITGIKQFSPFSGWQLANNALYAYRFVDSLDRVTLPNRFKILDQDVRNYFDSTRDLTSNPQEMLYASTVYMWDPISPLKIFENKFQKYDSTAGELTRWAKVAPLYKDYGATLIKNYPKTYLKYYIWPNFLKFYVPPVEFLGSYSTGVDSVPIVAKQWFWYKTNKLKTRVDSYNVDLFKYYPIYSASSNSVYIASSIIFILLFSLGDQKGIYKLWITITLFWTANFLFSIMASPIALRFQLFPLYLTTLGSLLILNKLLYTKLEKEIK